LAARLATRKRTERQKIGVGVGIGIGVERESACQRGYAVYEEAEEYRTNQIDPDTDADPDPERQP